MISLFFQNLLIAQKHSLCIVKSRESIVLSQYKCARLASRAFKAVRYSTELALRCKSFAKTMQNLDIDLNVFMCSFDAYSLFTNVPLDETIKISSEDLYDDSDLQPLIPKDVFVELMKSATSSVEFSFNNTMYKQTDGLAMESSLGPTLANIFVGYYGEALFS